MNDQQQQPTPSAETALPEDALVILPVRNMVLFPGTVFPITVGRARSVAGAQEAARNNLPVGVLLQRDPSVDEPTRADLREIGTLAHVARYLTGEDGAHHVVCQGVTRFRIVEFLDGYPFLVARVEKIEDPTDMTTGIEAHAHQLRQRAIEAIELLPQAPRELTAAIQSIAAPGALADFVAAFVDLDTGEKQEILETLDIEARLARVLELLSHRISVLKLSHQIGQQTRESLEARQREHLLREQMRQIQKELGEEDAKSAEIAELREAIEQAGMPDEVREQAEKELRRLERMPEAGGEYGMVRTYLDWLIELPWAVKDEPAIDIDDARRILEEDHYGLEKVKRRILEWLAVRKLAPHGRSPILCFVGPPGVGKTSLGQSIARATGREFVRIALGGVHDEAEVRGHRRTYIGAMPGNIIQSIRKAGTRNAVFMLDEMDKLSASFHGDPSAALLEVLDPEQNVSFRDTYLGVPFDLSQVVFIGTANVMDGIPGPLRDRMEIIDLAGYTQEEKLHIARRYLVKRQLEANGLSAERVEMDDEVLDRIISDYTREAGVRNLEREIGAVFRNVAVRIASGETDSVAIKPSDLHEILGPKRFESDVAMRTSVPGVATGLAWTPVGGDILFVESTRIPGGGKLILTGQLGDVMRESAQAALSLVKSRAEELGIDPAMFEKSDIHVHVPAGAIPKDGPSAGVAMFLSLVSLLTGRKIHSGLAMTGEISLRGLVLPVGGIKEKVVAAARAGIETVALPARNRKDFEEIPESARKQLRFVWLEEVRDVVEAAFEPSSEPRRQAASG